MLSSMTVLYGQWSWITPAIQGNDLYAVFFINNNLGWAGGAGTLLKTTNGGFIWQPVRTGIPNLTVGRIHFTDINTGYILHKQIFSDKLFKTTDGGFTWANITPAGVNDIYTFSFADKSTGYLCALFATYKTADAGASWVSSPSDSLNGISDIRFNSNGLGIAFTAGQNIIRFTTDKGATWQKKIMQGITGIMDAAFTSPHHGYVTATDSGVYKTNNGGAHMERLTSIYSEGRNIIQLINERTVLIAAQYSVNWSNDGGNNWVVVYFNAPQIHAVSFYDEQGGFMVGKYGALLKSTNSGLQWSGSLPSFYGAITSFEPVNGSYIYAATDRGVVIKINKYTYSLSVKYKFPFANITDLDFVDAQHGFAAVDSAIYKTTDGGSSWEKSLSQGGTSIYCVGFFNRDVGIAAGELQSLYRTTDGGATWTSLEPSSYPVAGVSRTMQIIDSSAAVITAGNGLVMKTTDMGSTWQRIDVDNGRILPAVHFSDRNTGFLGGAYETLYKTNDGGATWSSVPVPTVSSGTSAASFTSIKFWDDAHAIITATNGAALLSRDGGNTWTVSSSPAGYTGDAVTLDKGIALVGGGYGSILAFADPSQQMFPLNGDTYQLKQNYPNPFNPKTLIPVTLLEDAYISVKVYNIAGELVRELFSGALKSGSYQFTFDAGALPTGIYFARLQSGINFQTIKMMMVK